MTGNYQHALTPDRQVCRRACGRGPVAAYLHTLPDLCARGGRTKGVVNGVHTQGLDGKPSTRTATPSAGGQICGRAVRSCAEGGEAVGAQRPYAIRWHSRQAVPGTVHHRSVQSLPKQRSTPHITVRTGQRGSLRLTSSGRIRARFAAARAGGMGPYAVPTSLGSPYGEVGTGVVKEADRSGATPARKAGHPEHKAEEQSEH